MKFSPLNLARMSLLCWMLLVSLSIKDFNGGENPSESAAMISAATPNTVYTDTIRHPISWFNVFSSGTPS